jgi:hypothetical protein
MITIITAFLMLLMFTGPAHAYVDPGSGIFLLQILAAAGVGALFYLRRVREYIKHLFRAKRDPDPPPDGP